MGKVVLGMRMVLMRAVIFTLMLGVVLAIWKFMGKGAPIWDPHWFANAYSTVQGWMGTSKTIVNNGVSKIPTRLPKIPVPSSIHLPTPTHTPSTGHTAATTARASAHPTPTTSR